MTSEKRNILNRLLQVWPHGSVVVTPWLKSQGVSQQLVYEYEKSGWVRRVGRGAYLRAGEVVEWSGGLNAVQNQLGLPIHVADKTALQLQGYAHFLPLGKGGTLSLFGLPGTRLPAWFKKCDWGVALRYTTARLFSGTHDIGLTQKDMGSFSIRVSAPERAMMEVLYLVPKEESFEEAGLLMEGLATLRPDVLQRLLQQCRSVKVKRLFLYLAEQSNHSWLEKLDKAGINLGKGKRVIVKGGRLDAKYNITVPRSVGQRQEPTERV
ncbi:MAG: type IV toxin-antitoxin system AbiEi family antitoxin domain-containing protein [Desulfosalsimonadaceae bacterium]